MSWYDSPGVPIRLGTAILEAALPWLLAFDMELAWLPAIVVELPKLLAFDLDATPPLVRSGT